MVVAVFRESSFGACVGLFCFVVDDLFSLILCRKTENSRISASNHLSNDKYYLIFTSFKGNNLLID